MKICMQLCYSSDMDEETRTLIFQSKLFCPKSDGMSLLFFAFLRFLHLLILSDNSQYQQIIYPFS
jgi:hypothetical protein